MDDGLSKILIVDDNKDIHEDIRYILDASQASAEYMETIALREELFGEKKENHERIIDIKYRIDDAYQGDEAVRMVKRAKKEGSPYSLVFMDVRMPPGIDGIKAIEEIWKIEPSIEVVICTAYSDYSWNQILAKLGQNDHLLFIRKPFDSVSVKQIALSMTTKWNLQRQIRAHIMNLETEVEKRTQELRIMVDKLQTEIKLREEKEKLLAYNAHYDALTSLLNRRSFYSALPSLVNANSKNREPFSLFFLDIDNFKNVNDAYGHDTGDRLLIEISERIKESVGDRACTLNEFLDGGYFSKAVFRLGGDEFTVIVSEGKKEELEQIAGGLIERIREPYFIQGREITISSSIGISSFPDDAASSDALVKYSDIALYEAKKINGSYSFYNNPEGSDYINEIVLENDLHNALKRNQIDLYFQCLVNTKEKVLGIQALARWRHPEFGTLNPGQFIHIAEKTDQIITIGSHILNTALKRLKELHSKGYGDLFLLVNCTTRQFYNPAFISIVRKALNDARIPPKYLKLGLEEKFSVKATPGSLAIINELNRIGVQFTLNGFETEYPAFVFLQQMPRDTIIKINKEFVKNIVTDIKNRNFLLSLMDIIKSWNLNIIISGVENNEQKEILDEKDCILQGYHFNVPKPFNQFLDDLKSIQI